MLLDIVEQIFCKPSWKPFVNLFETHDMFGSKRVDVIGRGSAYVVFCGRQGHLTRNREVKKLRLERIDLALKLRDCVTASSVFSFGSLRYWLGMGGGLYLSLRGDHRAESAPNALNGRTLAVTAGSAHDTGRRSGGPALTLLLLNRDGRAH